MAVKLRTRQLKSGRISYYLDINHNGLRVKTFLKIPHSFPEKERQSLAEKMRMAKEVDLFRGGTLSYKSPKPRNFIQYFKSVVDSKPKNRKYLNTYNHFKKIFGSSLLTTQMNNKAIGLWKEYLIDNFRGETPATMWAAYRAVVNKAIREGFMDKNPAPDISAPKRIASMPKEILFDDEIKLLAQSKWPDEEVCRAFLFCCFTGLTLPDVKVLKWSQINNEKLRYTRKKTKGTVIVDLGQSAIKLMGIPDGEMVFHFLPSDSYCNRILKRWMKQVGITKNISWYSARHTFAVLLLSNGADLQTVSKLMGHSDITMTQKYLFYVDRLKREAVNKLPVI